MAVDLVTEVVGLKNAYNRMRGADFPKGVRDPRSNQPIAVPGKLIPRTTWADVIIAAAHINKYADPDAAQCLQILREAGENPSRCVFGPDNPRDFVRTASFQNAKNNFDEFSPFAVARRITGGSFLDGVKFAIAKIPTNGIFPRNEEFWGYAVRYAVARSAAGAVPFWHDIAVESIKEAIEEFPDTVKGAASAAFNAAGGLIPDVSGIVNLIKWGSIGGGLFALYWYVLRPGK